MLPTPRNCRKRMGRRRPSAEGVRASGAMAANSSPHRTARIESVRGPAKCFHHVWSHSHVRNRQLEGLSASRSFHSRRTPPNTLGSSIVSTLTAESIDPLLRCLEVQLQLGHVTGHVLHFAGGDVLVNRELQDVPAQERG